MKVPTHSTTLFRRTYAKRHFDRSSREFSPQPRRAFLILLSMLIAGCDDRPDQWDAYITYTEQPERSEIIAGFKTYELCRSASLARIEAEGTSETGYFECGYKCGFNRRYHMKLCKETRD
jgi:hypothetical protein